MTKIFWHSNTCDPITPLTDHPLELQVAEITGKSPCSIKLSDLSASEGNEDDLSILVTALFDDGTWVDFWLLWHQL